MKTRILVIIATLLGFNLIAQTADEDVNAGLADLAGQNLVQANHEFNAALALSPTNETANALAALTRLLVLPSQPAGSNFLSSLGFSIAGRDIYNWTSSLPVDVNGDALLPASNTATDAAYYRTNIMPVLAMVRTNLAAITDPTFTLSLTADQTTLQAVTVDYGDFLLMQAMERAAEFAGYTANAQNDNVILRTLQEMSKANGLTAQSVLAEFPSLLTLANSNDLVASESALTNAITLYFEASDFIRNVRQPGASALFILSDDETNNEALFRTELTNVLLSLTGPVPIGTPFGTLAVNSSNYFAGTVNLRSLAPKFTGNVYVPASLPDYSFGGILPDEPSWEIEKILLELSPSFSGIYIGDQGQLYNGNPPVSDDNYANGSFALFVGTNSQSVLVGQDNGDGTGDDTAFGFFAQFTIAHDGSWSFENDDVQGFGSVDRHGNFSGELDYSSGISVFLNGAVASPIGSFESAAGYYKGTFNGVHSGAFYSILAADGEIFYLPIASSGSIENGGAAQLAPDDEFANTSVTGTVVKGVLKPSNFSITGTYTNIGGTGGTFTESVSARDSAEVAPSITSQLPANYIAQLGTNVTFALGVAGSAPLSFQWSSNSVPIPGATSNKLVLHDIQYAAAGDYSVTVTNLFGGTNSDVMLTVVPETVPPTNDITSPKPGQLWSNSVFTVTGKAGDNVAVANVFVLVNSNGWNPATQVNNTWSNWTAQVTLSPGTNTIQAYAVDTSGNISKTNTVSLIYVLSAVLTVDVGTGGTVSPNYNGALLELGKMYSMTVKTNAGFVFTGWTGSITTNKTVLNFLMASNLIFNANFADVQPPTNEITSPKTGQLWSNSVFTVTGKSGDNVAVSNVFVSVNNGGWTNATQVNNTWSNWTALVTLTPGTNHIAVYSVDTSENISKTNTVSLVYVLSAVLAVSTNGKGTITPNDNGALLQLGKTYSLTAGTVADSGFAFTNWTGGTNLPLSVLTNKPVVQFIMQSNLMLQANFVYTNRPNLSITNPVAIERVSNTMFTVRGTASDKSGVSGVYYSLNGSGYTLASTGNGWTNWLVTVNLAMGTNNISVYAVNASNNLSVVKTAVIIRVPTTAVFPIATGDNIQHPQAKLAFDGTNYLVVFQVYPPGSDNSTAAAQFVSPGGELIGAPLELNAGGQDNAPNAPSVAFDGVNYLAAWADDPGDGPVSGVFVSPDGAVGTPGQISQSTTVDDFGTIVFGGGEYFLMWSDSRTTPDSLYGAIFSTAGTVLASDFLISTNAQPDIPAQSSAAFDGTNFLAVWSSATNKTSVNGQLISVLGTLVGSPFVIYTNSTPAGEGAPSITFDGTKYLVLFNVGLNSNNPTAFHILGRFVTTAGEVLPNNITLTSDAGPQIFAGSAFDGENFLVTWNQGLNPFKNTTTGVTINGRFMDDEGAPVTAEFPIFTTQNDRIPTWAPVLFDGTQYVLVTGLGQMVSPVPHLHFTNGIISGAIVAP